LWVSDGTPEGTVLVKDIFPGPESSYIYPMKAIGDVLFFGANDGVHGCELWRSDGTPEGTVLVKEVVSGSDNHCSSSESPYVLLDVDGLLLFAAAGALWRSDGTAEGTVEVRRFGRSDLEFGDEAFTALNGMLLFSATSELWRSDGTREGTRLVKDLDPDGHSSPYWLTRVDDLVFFEAGDEHHGRELWASDGTRDGTILVRDIRTGPYDSEIRNMTAAGGHLFFTADNDVHGRELWMSDGTRDGTVMVADLIPGAAGGLSPSSEIGEAGGFLYFSGRTSVEGR